MKYAREIKVGVLAAVCLFLLFFGLNFLKGVNIFSPTNSYHGVFYNLHGLEEQAAVYIRGHRVGQVDVIHYDFTADSAFTVDLSIRKDIALPQGTAMALVSDGLLGGMAVELQFPENTNNADLASVEKGAYLPTMYVPGIMESLKGDLMAHIDQAILSVDSLVASLQDQVNGGHIKSSLVNVDRITSDLTTVSSDLKHVMKNQVPRIVNNADTTLANLNAVVADIKSADLASTVARVDTAVENVNSLVTEVRKPIAPLMQHIDATVVSADSLLVDLKAHPKRYVHFSLFGKKDK
jgi:phospholipid/cholesterol/gamma-HCH transport system substrate-binding protein